MRPFMRGGIMRKGAREAAFGGFVLLASTHCGSHMAVRSAPGFAGGQLNHQTVLVLPIAVTDDFSDVRTGIALDQGTREDATRMACRSASEGEPDLILTCFNSPNVTTAKPRLRRRPVPIHSGQAGREGSLAGTRAEDRRQFRGLVSTGDGDGVAPG